MGSDKGEAARFRRPRQQAVASKEGADWTVCDAQLLQRVIATAGLKKCALRFGYTRDGGAYSIGVYAGDEYFTDFIRPDDDIDVYLRDLLESLEEYTPGETPPPEKRHAGRK